MKWSTVILIMVSFHACSPLNAQLISLNEKNIRLEKLLPKISEQTGFLFFYSLQDVQGSSPVTINITNAPLETVLQRCLVNQSLSYEIINGTIVLRKTPAHIYGRSRVNTGIAISGAVRGEDGPLESVSVKVKDEGKGTSTDRKGEYLLMNVNINATLIISAVGYETREIAVHAKKKINVTLRKLLQDLDETVIIGYGTTTRKNSTGSVAKISGEQISRQPVSNPLSALQGRIPGLFITQNTGVPGGAFTVQLRGKNSIANGNDPLYLIDGVPIAFSSLSSSLLSLGITRGGNILSMLNPGDIESIEILKDADATAIYGARGANGVVIITTKKGQAGKTRLDINLYTGVGKITRTMRLLNTEQYLEMRKEAFRNDNAVPDPSADYDLTSWDTTRYTDWQKLICGSMMQLSSAQVTVSGGNKYNHFLTGASYYHESTVFPGDFSDVKRSAHITLTRNSRNSKFNVRYTARYFSENNTLPSADATGQSVVIAPNAPAPHDERGVLNWENGTFNNPLAVFFSRYKMNYHTLLSNLTAAYQLTKELELKNSIGMAKMEFNEIVLYPGTVYNPAYNTQGGNSSFAHNTTTTWIAEPQLLYTRKVSDGKLQVMTGSTFQQNAGEEWILRADGFESDDQLNDPGLASVVTGPYRSKKKYRYMSIFSRVNYNWQGKYLVNVNARFDGSSRFSPDNQVAFFGSVGGAWIFSKEKFFSKYPGLISYGKLRASIGTVGNDQIADHQNLYFWNAASSRDQYPAGVVPGRLFNANYSWETNSKTEAALELRFLKDRLFISGSYYRNVSINQLIGRTLPLITGFSSILDNMPAIVRNTGMEFEFTSVNIQARSFRWSVSLNVTFPHNKLITDTATAASTDVGNFPSGRSLFVHKAYHYTGIDPVTGIYRFSDKNADGIISFPKDLYDLKESSQRFYGGLQNSFEYRNWKADIFFQFVKQTGKNFIHSIFDAPGTFVNQPAEVMNRWQKPGDERRYQKFTQDVSSAAYQAFTMASYSGDNVISDASYIRLKNLSVSYHVPVSRISKWKLQSARIYFQAQNVLTITKYAGTDPENQSLNIMPPLKLFTVGFQVSI